jgi:hypothetical protein
MYLKTMSFSVAVVGVKGTGKSSWIKAVTKGSETGEMVLVTTKEDYTFSFDELVLDDGQESLAHIVDIQRYYDVVVILYDACSPISLMSAIQCNKAIGDIHPEVYMVGMFGDLLGWDGEITPGVVLDSSDREDCGRETMVRVTRSLLEDDDIEYVDPRPSKMSNIEGMLGLFSKITTMLGKESTTSEVSGIMNEMSMPPVMTNLIVGMMNGARPEIVINRTEGGTIHEPTQEMKDHMKSLVKSLSDK